MRKRTRIALIAVAALVGVGAFAQAKIAVVDTMKVASDSKMGKKIQAELQAYHQQKQQAINSKEAELKALDEKAKDPKISQERKDDLKSQFNQKMYEYQAFAKAAQEDMKDRTQRKQADFNQKLAGVINQYARSEGFSLVIEKGICLYNADALDVTVEVTAAMDQAYPGT